MAYLLLGAAGTAVSWYYTYLYSQQHGWFSNEFTTDQLINAAAASGAADMTACTAIAFVWILAEAKRLEMRHRWRFVAVLFMVSLSAALAWFLWERDRTYQELS